jgi:hypothetical protein
MGPVRVNGSFTDIRGGNWHVKITTDVYSPNAYAEQFYIAPVPNSKGKFAIYVADFDTTYKITGNVPCIVSEQPRGGSPPSYNKGATVYSATF